MKDKLKKFLLVFLCIFGLTMVSSVSQAAPIETISYTTGVIDYSADQFTGPSYNIDGVLSFPKFDPSLGYIKKVKLTATLVSAGSSTIEVENEREDNPQYPVLHAGGWFMAGCPGDGYSEYFVFNVSNAAKVAQLEIDDEPGAGPNW